MKKLIALLVVTNLLWFVVYVYTSIDRDEYRDQVIKADAAIKSLPDTKRYYLGQERNGDLIVTCLNGNTPTAVSGSVFDITCGGQQ